jgi:hypothetical protein
MKQAGIRWTLVAVGILLFVLHQDDWLAGSTTRVLGFPASLTWHLGLCVLAAGLMAAAVQFAWPQYLDDDSEPEPEP